MSLVSIIIPVYNAEKYLSECIRSALAQTGVKKELIIVDDGSKDNSLSVAKRFENKEVKVISQENKGASAARNLGLKYARGAYIQFLDADDQLGPDKIRLQLDAIEDKNFAVAVGRTFRFSELAEVNEQMAVDDWCLRSTKLPSEFFVNMWGGYEDRIGMIQPNAWLTPKALIDQHGGWNESLSLNDDGEFFSRIVLNANEIVFCPEAINFYRRSSDHANLAAQNKQEHLESAIQALDLQASYLFEKTRKIEAKKAISRLYMLLATNSYLINKAVSKKAEIQASMLMNKPPIPALGGKATEFLKIVLGWKRTLVLLNLMGRR